MKHFNYLSTEEKNRIFYKEPGEISYDTDKELLSRSLGATLYIPGIKADLHNILATNKIKGLASIVLCLEDAISDNQLKEAEANIVHQLTLINEDIEQGIMTVGCIPFIFVRVRDDQQFGKIFKNLSVFKNITGIVFPKFSIENARRYIDTLHEINERFKEQYGRRLYFMPILETEEVINYETRRRTLTELVALLEPVKDLVLNIRIGATDFSGLFGLRRNSDNTVYDIAILRECISDIVNCFARIDRNYVISGPVWEYFGHDERLMKPRLRTTPFFNRYGEKGVIKRKKLLNKYLDGLIYEASFDNINGLTGKTVIHPSHIIPVQSLLPVAYEDYIDAKNIVESGKGNNGVFKSRLGNKMNEVKPHMFWAKKTMIKGQVYGVLNENMDYTSLLININ